MADPQAGRSPARSEPPRGFASREASEGTLWLDLHVPLPPPGGMTVFEAGGLRLVLCNAGGAPYVLQDRCPHAFVYLSGGRLEGTVLECPLHGGKLDVRDGRPVAAPIRKPVRTFAVRQSGARLQVAIDPAAEPPRP